MSKKAPFAQNVADELALIRNVLAGNTGGIVYGFHVNQTESDPYERVTYLRDAVGMMPAKMNYDTEKFDYGTWGDAFFMPRPCMVRFDGTVDYYLDPNNYALKEDGTASDANNVDYQGNAMMEWGRDGKKIWYKIVPDATGSGYSVFVADHKEDSNYVAWSFINNQDVYVSHFYTAIYNGCLDSNNRLRSIGGLNIMKNKTATEEMTYAKNNYSSSNMWLTETFADVTLINLLLILIGKSTDTQSVFGQGLTSGGETAMDAYSPNELEDKGLFWGANDTTHGVKVFGMENWWGCQWRRIAGLMSEGGDYYYKLTYGTADGSEKFGYNANVTGMLEGGTMPNSGWQSELKIADNSQNSALLPSGVVGSASTYYCDYWWKNNNTNYALRGGNASNDSLYGAFYLNLDTAAVHRHWGLGAALSLKPLAR